MPLTLPLDAGAKDASARRALLNLSLAVTKSKRIVVVTGAGISCSCGIPDFRSQDGLYNLVKRKHPDAVLKGRDLFDASLFRNPASTSTFYSFIAGLKQAIDDASPSHTHRFIKALDAKGRLLRSYTQNIDGLEERAGLLGSSSQEAKVPSPAKSKAKAKARLKIKDVRNVQLHGDIHRVRCTVCSADYPCSTSYLEMFSQGFPPDCPDCTTRSQARVARSARALKIGTLRPAIVLYDEPHPLGDEIGQIQAADVRKGPDLLIIMGTSLKVHGLKKLVKQFAKVIHTRRGPKTPGIVIFVNKTPPGSEWDGVIDYHVEGDTDSWTEKVIADWKKHKPTDWEHQTTLVEGLSPFRISNGVLGGQCLLIFFATFP
ncbi:DHS-like NAD/FAD-binding domain-containing protein [Thelephora ganbajun]|uniref:DHS-like NAD/FAD-binding domain-containing protein n=1 Tax=Thelephora ganbajun TaxID=370292 RepID=A0ACB6Z2V5_THEGA|nr:DHS-like NAD/FAD-binding domain-containing protein [Thelephora ganbajun]